MYAQNSKGEKAELIVRRALAKGYVISVHDGGEYAVKQSDNFAAIIDAMGNTGEDTLRIRQCKNGAPIGSILLIWGNSPHGDELAADYSDTPEIEELVK